MRRLNAMSVRLALLVAVAGLLVVGGPAAYQAYLRHRHATELGYAQKARADGDFTAAWMWLARVLKSAPDDLDALRFGAQLSEAADQPDAPLWWVKIHQLQPQSIEPLYQWAKSALRQGQYDSAQRALDLVPLSQRSDASYHQLKAGVALAAGNSDLADGHFLEAARLEPGNPLHLVNLASLRLNARDAKVASAAREALERDYLPREDTRLLALRALLGDALKRSDREAAASLEARVRQEPGRTWNDEILCLSALDRLSDPAFMQRLAQLRSQAGTHLERAVPLADWLSSQGHAEKTRTWLWPLLQTERNGFRIDLCLVNALTVLGRWADLRDWLQSRRWDQLDPLRRAVVLRARRELGEPFEGDWRKLTSELNDTPDALLLVAQAALSWGWKAEAETLLWRAAQKTIAIRLSALRLLWTQYASEDRTNDLLRVAREQYTDAPESIETRNNYAFLSLLLDVNLETAHRLAREIGSPMDAPVECVVTYAYSLCKLGSAPAAMERLAKVHPTRIVKPEVALYHALAAKEAGDLPAFRTALGYAATGSFLPEEKLLLSALQSFARSAP